MIRLTIFWILSTVICVHNITCLKISLMPRGDSKVNNFSGVFKGQLLKNTSVTKCLSFVLFVGQGDDLLRNLFYEELDYSVMISNSLHITDILDCAPLTPRPNAVIFFASVFSSQVKQVAELIYDVRMSPIWYPELEHIMILDSKATKSMEITINDQLVRSGISILTTIIWDASIEEFIIEKNEMNLHHINILIVPEFADWCDDDYVDDSVFSFYNNMYLIDILVKKIPAFQRKKCIVQDHLSFGTQLPNGTYTRNLGILMEGRALLVGLPRTHNVSWQRMTDFLLPHEKNDVCVLAPIAEPLSFLPNMISIFSNTTWISLIIVLVLFCFTHFFIVFIHEDTNLIKSINSLFWPLSTILTGQFSFVKGKFLYLYLIISFLIYLMIGNVVIGGMTGRLAVVIYPNNLRTLEELNDAIDYLYSYPTELEIMLSGENSHIMKQLAKKVVILREVNDLGDVVKKIRKRQRVAIVLGQRTIDKVYAIPLDEQKGSMIVYKLPECVMAPNFASFSVARLPGLLNNVQSLVLQIQAAGLSNRLEDLAKGIFYEMMSLSFLHIQNLKPDIPEPYALTLDHIQFAFYLILGGLFISGVVFVSELLFHRLSVRTKELFKNNYWH